MIKDASNESTVDIPLPFTPSELACKTCTTTSNSYGELLCDFLCNVNCCILNGRNGINNDYTYISTRGSSVVDYCIVPYEQLNSFQNFEVIRAADIVGRACPVGSYEPRHIPDHSLLTWSFCIAHIAPVENAGQPRNYAEDGRRRYKVSNPLPTDWMACEDTVRKLNELVSKLEVAINNQHEIDVYYNEFTSVIHNEMKSNFQCRGTPNDIIGKGFRSKKPWWNDQLTSMWQNVRAAERCWLRSNGGFEKRNLRAKYCALRKQFDKSVQQAKRKQWYRNQEELLEAQQSDPKEFWRKIGKIGVGSERQKNISFEVTNDDGSVCVDKDRVLDKWADHFSNLLNVNNGDTVCANNNTENVEDEYLDSSISFQDVYKAVFSLKNGKAEGVDDLPAEVLKCEKVIHVLHKLISSCFESGMIPSEWNKGIIAPVPKGATSNPMEPTTYRGITMTSCVYKVYCKILNERLYKWVDDRGILYDEQNGFRQKRSTIDHVSSITSIIETRKQCKMPTFASFIDFRKAYDNVNRDLLFENLTEVGISTKFLGAIKAIFLHVQCCVKVNNSFSRWFGVTQGLKQGCILSPILFNMFINTLVTDIKALDVGIDIDGEKLAILLYADDIVLLAENENDLQLLLDVLNRWCVKYHMSVNIDKSKVVHFRGPSVARTNNIFVLGDNIIEIVPHYTYLGLLLTEFLDYDSMAKAVAKSASRALGLLIVKSKAIGGFHYNTYTKLFDTIVGSVIEYRAAIWGFRSFSCINAVQNRAMRFLWVLISIRLMMLFLEIWHGNLYM